MSKYSDRAVQLFCEGKNCSQSVFTAFAEDMGIDTETALRISAGLGGGVGRLREVCGAISGSAMLVGLRFPDYDRAGVYEKVREITEEFKKKNPSIVCRELLGISSYEKSSVPEARTEEYYKKRPCAELVRDAAEAAEKILFAEEKK